MDKESSLQKKTILVIDDDESICSFLRVLLEKEGFNVEVKFSGEAGVKSVASSSVDLVILDWMMPILSGFEVLRMLQSEEHRDVPVIVITARVTDKSTVDLIKQEMNVVDFVTKPIKQPQFVSTVHQILKTESPKEKNKNPQ